MSEAKRLLEQATPLPWTASTEGHASIRSAAGHVTRDLFAVGQSVPRGASRELRDTFHDLTYIEVEDGPRIALTGNGPKPTHNAALIVYAVNRLPDYEAAVEALESVLRIVQPEYLSDEGAVENAWTVLARLREGVTA